MISWQSKRIRRVVKSALAAETLALLDVAEAGIHTSHIISKILAVGVNAPIVNSLSTISLWSHRRSQRKELKISNCVSI